MVCPPAPALAGEPYLPLSTDKRRMTPQRHQKLRGLSTITRRSPRRGPTGIPRGGVIPRPYRDSGGLQPITMRHRTMTVGLRVRIHP